MPVVDARNLRGGLGTLQNDCAAMIEGQISFPHLYRQRRADEARGNGIGDFVDTDRTSAGDDCGDFLSLGEAAGGQGFEERQLLIDLARAQSVRFVADLGR